MHAQTSVPQTNAAPYLSVVAASRNDDHGGDPLIRTQIFINTLARQCEKYRLSAELIIVDWNPVTDRPGLAAVLSTPDEAFYCKARVITVPTALHCRLKYSDKLAFFQMIAKNVAIRRARGKFILATNIDIIFSDELMRFIARQNLNATKCYRVDRYDIRNGLSKDFSLDETLEYAWANPIRTNRRYQPFKLVQCLYENDGFRKVCIPDQEFRGTIDGVDVIEEDGVWQIRAERSVNMSHLHTNACGDFTLLSRDAWFAIRGYPEFEAFSFNIDSMGLAAAHYAGYGEVSLLPPCVCFHIEHGIGSGWTPEGEEKLFNRLRQAEILNPEWPILTPLVDIMHKQAKSLEFNNAGWGMAKFELPEQPMGDTEKIPIEKLEQLTAQAESLKVSAIQPEYDFDRLTLAHERRMAERQQGLGSAFTANTDKIVLYIPDSTGSYEEGRSIVYFAHLVNTTTVIFRVERFAHQFRLRLDPCQCPGLITINSITAFDIMNRKVVWEIDGRHSSRLDIAGTAMLINHWSRGNGHRMQQIFRRERKYHEPLSVISTGLDPQLILPILPENAGFPLLISIEMKVIPCE
ncbi:MAG TPA: hypothetical protein VFQ78_14760 [Candidatus Udaeobacter sp.]|jgi:hypothetical protein|nr:hypothetical protein [Candidatus Udaeobacter sp.]